MKMGLYKIRIVMKHEHFSIVLVEPQGPLNIGSVCRAIMNFGFSDLRLVNPCKEYKSHQARKMALTAQHMLKDAKLFDSLEDALGDRHLALGATRRFGKYRKDFLPPDTTGKLVSLTDDSHKLALVLGREDHGLNTHELSLCQHFITIPTNDAFPSMNLSHSLSILLYEISKEMKNQTSQPVSPKPLASIKAIEEMFEHMKKALCNIEFLDPQNPDHLLMTFRRIFGRAGLMERDVKIIRGLMSRIEWIDGQRKK